MSEKVVNIARNTSFFTIALILQKAISFAYFVILAAYLAPELLGQYYFAISFAAIAAMFLDLGLGNVLVREIAKDNSRSGILLGGVILIKIPLLIISLGIVALSGNYFGYGSLVMTLIYLAAMNVALDSFSANFYAVIRGHHRLIFESIGHVLFQLIALVCGFFFLRSGLGLIWLMSAMTLASLFGFTYSLSLLLAKFRIKINFRQSVAPIWSLLLVSIPFSLYALMQKAYLYLDTVLLKNMAGEYYAGLYQIAFKIVFALQFLPMAFVASLYPALSKYHQEGSPRLETAFSRAFSYLLIISIPIAVGIIFIADGLVALFRPEYAAAAAPLKIVMMALPFIFLNYASGSLLNACDRQKINTRNMAFALTASVALNIFLIPRYDVYGASFSLVASSVLLFSLNFLQVSSLLNSRLTEIVKTTAKVFVAAVFMAIFLEYAGDLAHIAVLVPAAAVLYFVLLFILKGFSAQDIKYLLSSFKDKKT